VQRPDGRWATDGCTDRHRAACLRGTTWTITPALVPFTGAAGACRAQGARFAVPRSGLQNNELRAAVPAGGTVWIAHRVRSTPG
jgi:hypothetical protein